MRRNELGDLEEVWSVDLDTTISNLRGEDENGRPLAENDPGAIIHNRWVWEQNNPDEYLPEHLEVQLFVLERGLVPGPVLEHATLLKRTEPHAIVVEGIEASIERVVERTFIGPFEAKAVSHVAIFFPVGGTGAFTPAKFFGSGIYRLQWRRDVGDSSDSVVGKFHRSTVRSTLRINKSLLRHAPTDP